MNSPSNKFLHKFLEDKYWKLLTTIDSLNQDVSFTELIVHLGIQYTVDDINEVVGFLKKFGHPVKIENREKGTWIVMTGKKPQFKMNLSLSEWIAFQSHFPLMEENRGTSIHNTLATALTRIENRYPEADLFNYIKDESELTEAKKSFGHDQETLLKAINEAHIKENHILIESKEKRETEVFIHKLVYIDGILSIIGEDTNDRCLTCIDTNEIETYSILEKGNYRPNFATAEVDDFILAVRSITGNEERLVMKVTSPDRVNLSPEFHFLGNPFVTTNTEGEFIWAASVEVSPELYKWLSTIYGDIDIIDPKNIKEGLEEFMEQKETLSHLKKAS